MFKKNDKNKEVVKQLLQIMNKCKQDSLEDRVQALSNYADNVMLTALESIVEVQTITQLLINKGIVSTEEVDTMRDYMMENTDYGKMLNDLGKHLIFNSESYERMLMQLKIADPDSLTQEEHEYLANRLQLEYQDQSAREFEDILYRFANDQEITDEERAKALAFLKTIDKELEKEN